MAVRKFKPTTPGQRHKIIGTFEELLHQYQKRLSFVENVLQAAVTMSVR